MQLVTLKNGSQQEKDTVFVVVEDNGDRLMISPVDTTMTISPIELVHKNDVCYINDANWQKQLTAPTGAEKRLL